VLAYSPVLNGHCEVLFADGSVQQMNADRFDALSQRGLVQLATPQEIAMHQQQAAIAGSQLANAPGAMPATTASAGSAAAGEPGAIEVSRRTVRKIRQGLFWAFAYNALGIPLAALGYLSPMVAGGAMALSSVSVVCNALLLRRWRPLTGN